MNIPRVHHLVLRSGSPSAWKNDRVNHVDNAVGGHDIRLDDTGVVDPDSAARVDLDLLAQKSLGLRELHDVFGQDIPGYNVILEDAGQLVGIGQQLFQRAGGQLGEGFVRGGEDGERAVAAQSVAQPGSVDRG